MDFCIYLEIDSLGEGACLTISVDSLMHQIVEFMATLDLCGPCDQKSSHFSLGDLINLRPSSFLQSLPDPKLIIQTLDLVWKVFSSNIWVTAEIYHYVFSLGE